MQLARVLGEVVATIKDANLTGMKLLVLQPLSPAGEAVGRSLVAIDSVGAGVGENVFFVRGREAAFPFYPAEPPTDAAIIGIVDRWDVPPRTSQNPAEPAGTAQNPAEPARTAQNSAEPGRTR